ncbi:MAG: Methionine aminopeptidase [Candidatus Taylorbacteria bacterium]|nr:Methionine aminopeptidase [Candidatus Taylorbacteria bacterium]
MIRLKTKEDIAILREGGKRHAAILRALAAMVKPGATTQALEDEARRLIALGADANGKPDSAAFLNYQPVGAERPFPAALCVSINDEVVHGIPNEHSRMLKEGDIVSLDLGLIHGGLITDAAVTVPVGNISAEIAALLETTKVALMAGIKAAKGGKKTGDIGQAVERIGLGAAGGKGYGIVEELCGHGVGYDVHEEPYVPNYGEAGKGVTLKPGMVIAIEPMFNLGTRHLKLDKDGYTYLTKDGKASAHFEHTILITKGGAEILTA